MKHIAIIGIFLIGLFSSLNAQKNLKFGYIDLQKLIAQMPEADSAKRTLEKETKAIKDQLETMQVELNNKYNDYLNKADSMTAFIKQSKEVELQDMQERISNFSNAGEQNIQQLQAKLYQPIIDKAQKAINTVAQANGFTYIFDLSANFILYHAPETEDITPLVKQNLGLK